MKNLDVSYVKAESSGTLVYVAVDGNFAGSIVISDKIKPSAKTAMEELKKAGIKRLVMLTGDAKHGFRGVAWQSRKRKPGLGCHSTPDGL